MVAKFKQKRDHAACSPSDYAHAATLVYTFNNLVIFLLEIIAKYLSNP